VTTGSRPASGGTTQPDGPDGGGGVERRIGARVLALVRGDITSVPADAIVNAANSALRGGGGVDGAIHRAGGPAVMAELSSRYDGCPTGGAVATGAGQLPARWVIHAVGPRWAGGRHGERELLASAYREALARADELGARTVTFPAISCGIYGYPLAEGASVALTTVREHLMGETSVERATFVLYSAETYEAFRAALEALGRATESEPEGH
jgi:O-acetyl-ADP-ribose deacetylase (regulator of RNase III)